MIDKWMRGCEISGGVVDRNDDKVDKVLTMWDASRVVTLATILSTDATSNILQDYCATSSLGMELRWEFMGNTSITVQLA